MSQFIHASALLVTLSIRIRSKTLFRPMSLSLVDFRLTCHQNGQRESGRNNGSN